MIERDPFKIEVWLDGEFYNKFDADPAGYDLIKILQDFKDKMQQGLMPSAKKIEIRRAL